MIPRSPARRAASATGEGGGWAAPAPRDLRPTPSLSVGDDVRHATLGEGTVEVASRDEPRGSRDPPAGEAAQPARDLGELWHAIDRQGEPLDSVEEGAARVLVVQVAQRPLHGRPRLVLGVGVVDEPRRVAGPQAERAAGDLVATAQVARV